ncbi:MAG TPA: deoxyribodipyrimidine photo-lyase [Flavitalea sp.]|nr:deoxyribodipyrimidine photo-lyase [Flavitalea sp.]
MNIFWFRRDLRLDDNAGLYHALKQGKPVIPVFILDTNILDDLEDKDDARVNFICGALSELNEQLIKFNSSLHVYHGDPETVFKDIVTKFQVEKVFTNGDYETYATERDNTIRNLLAQKGITFHSYKDHVIFEKNEVVKDDGSPYVVFTPYSRKWKFLLNDFYLRAYPTEKYFNNFYRCSPLVVPSIESIGFSESRITIPGKEVGDVIFKNYKNARDYPGEQGTSRIGIHLRFGTLSIRQLARQVRETSEAYLNELIWRDFYQMVLFEFPHVGRGAAFKKEYDQIEWRNNEDEFLLWCKGETGYPLVDAGMRQLNATGFMHNRVRMVTASFLTKHLLIDWRWGEAYFARFLLDYDFASNNGGWQWAAGSGCDASPYFRIFNPTAQAKKFDPELKYINKWVPEINSFQYPAPIVAHEFARERCLSVYSKGLKK